MYILLGNFLVFPNSSVTCPTAHRNLIRPTSDWTPSSAHSQPRVPYFKTDYVIITMVYRVQCPNSSKVMWSFIQSCEWCKQPTVTTWLLKYPIYRNLACGPTFSKRSPDQWNKLPIVGFVFLKVQTGSNDYLREYFNQYKRIKAVCSSVPFTGIAYPYQPFDKVNQRLDLEFNKSLILRPN